MRRLIAMACGLLVCGVVALAGATIAQGSDTYRFDALFNDASGLISGQQVKIAGASAGTITNVVVDGGNRARVEATIQGPFQFHADATCAIRPDGLIAENYLDCDPGSRSAPMLAAHGGYPPTLPTSQTSKPVTLQDLFNIFDVPTRERFQVLIDELGIATAGNGSEINQILRQANPTLQAAQRVIGVLTSQDQNLATAIDASDQIVRAGAPHTDAIRAFIDRASALTQLTADHRSSLSQAVAKLPAFLAAMTPALHQLQLVSDNGTPLLAELRAAAPALNRVNADIVPFTRRAQPALASLAALVSTATPDARTITPLTATLANYLHVSGPSTRNFSNLLINLIQHGFSENFLSVLYYVATALGKYDATSHMLSSLLIFPGAGACGTYSTTVSTNPQCVAHYATQTAAAAARRPATGRTRASATPQRTATAGARASGNGHAAAPTTVTGLLGGLLGGVSGTLGHLTGAAGGHGHPGSTGTSSTSTQPLSNLLGYLLK